jgi:hypothetical protein
MLLKRNNKGLKVRSQPKLERRSTRTIGLESGTGSTTVSRAASRMKFKHASTLSCLAIEKPVRNRRQRKSLEDVTNDKQ